MADKGSGQKPRRRPRPAGSKPPAIPDPNLSGIYGDKKPKPTGEGQNVNRKP